MTETNKNVIVLTKEQLAIILATTIVNSNFPPKGDVDELVGKIIPKAREAAQSLIELYNNGGLEE